MTWDDFQRRVEGPQLTFLRSTSSILSMLEQSRNALIEENVDFFVRFLAAQEHYRLALAFPTRTMFLDIETTGLSRYYDDITMIGWRLNGKYFHWLRGESLSMFEEALTDARVLVTFNGSLFDLPFLRSEFPALVFPRAHIDLRFLLKRVGLPGGQKTIEKQLRITRPLRVQQLTSSIAPLLWYRFIRGDLEAGRLLVEYNRADVLGMCRLLDIGARRAGRKGKIPRRIFPSTTFAAPEVKFQVAITDASAAKARAAVRSAQLDITDLMPASLLAKLRIVGIDLTGSEARPTGWASFAGSEVITQRIGSDDDLIAATVAFKPTIVSIDSPLSLPEGRMIPSDDDPGRSQYGITRQCERTLRARGVNVYPCLIPSMQKLTERGIRLTARMRRLGIPVIESFPGAAQDILNIPRKRASLELLKSGLVAFGLHGQFVETTISHDELDAITSALVGVFFWAGRVEFLGNEVEDYLIVPAREPRSIWTPKLAIGLSGEINAGKTTAGMWISESGFAYSRTSLVLEDILKRSGHKVSRSSLQDLGRRLHISPGQRWLIQQTLARCDSADKVVIDGIRWHEDHAFLVERFGPAFLHTHIDAPLQARVERSGVSAAVYNEMSSHEVEREAAELKHFATAVISNADDLLAFRKKVANLLTRILPSSHRVD